MAANQMNAFLQHLRGTMLSRDGTNLTDGQLLENYLHQRDEAALVALVRRHAPMVWGVCRRLLPNHHDAEDAFQATFLVFVRKAPSIAARALLANWLYGVARQTALKARATAAKRKGRERQVAEMPEPAVTVQDLWNDLQPLLDEELSRLPAKYRSVLVLCELEGKTRKEAARQLGVPEGTVGGWLARARALLAKRLARHGLTVSSAALALMFSRNAASAILPPAVLSSTIKAVTSMAAGQAANTGALSASVAALTEGVMKTMLLSKLRIATAIVLALIVSASGAGSVWVVQKALASKPSEPTAPQQKNAAPAPTEQVQQASKLDLTPESLAKLCASIRPQGNEWRHLRIHWYTDVVAARKKAAQEDKPILVFRTGGAGYNDPLGQC